MTFGVLGNHLRHRNTSMTGHIRPPPPFDVISYRPPFPTEQGDYDGRFNIMADSIEGVMTNKRVNLYNPENRKHYKIRYRKAKKGEKVHLINEWSP
jgi:hypothetical protein